MRNEIKPVLLCLVIPALLSCGILPKKNESLPDGNGAVPVPTPSGPQSNAPTSVVNTLLDDLRVRLSSSGLSQAIVEKIIIGAQAEVTSAQMTLGLSALSSSLKETFLGFSATGQTTDLKKILSLLVKGAAKSMASITDLHDGGQRIGILKEVVKFGVESTKTHQSQLSGDGANSVIAEVVKTAVASVDVSGVSDAERGNALAGMVGAAVAALKNAAVSDGQQKIDGMKVIIDAAVLAIPEAGLPPGTLTETISEIAESGIKSASASGVSQDLLRDAAKTVTQAAVESATKMANAANLSEVNASSVSAAVVQEVVAALTVAGISKGSLTDVAAAVAVASVEGLRSANVDSGIIEAAKSAVETSATAGLSKTGSLTVDEVLAAKAEILSKTANAGAPLESPPAVTSLFKVANDVMFAAFQDGDGAWMPLYASECSGSGCARPINDSKKRIGVLITCNLPATPTQPAVVYSRVYFDILRSSIEPRVISCGSSSSSGSDPGPESENKISEPSMAQPEPARTNLKINLEQCPDPDSCAVFIQPKNENINWMEKLYSEPSSNWLQSSLLSNEEYRLFVGQMLASNSTEEKYSRVQGLRYMDFTANPLPTDQYQNIVFVPGSELFPTFEKSISLNLPAARPSGLTLRSVSSRLGFITLISKQEATTSSGLSSAKFVTLSDSAMIRSPLQLTLELERKENEVALDYYHIQAHTLSAAQFSSSLDLLQLPLAPTLSRIAGRPLKIELSPSIDESFSFNLNQNQPNHLIYTNFWASKERLALDKSFSLPEFSNTVSGWNSSWNFNDRGPINADGRIGRVFEKYIVLFDFKRSLAPVENISQASIEQRPGQCFGTLPQNAIHSPYTQSFDWTTGVWIPESGSYSWISYPYSETMGNSTYSENSMSVELKLENMYPKTLGCKYSCPAGQYKLGGACVTIPLQGCSNAASALDLSSFNNREVSYAEALMGAVWGPGSNGLNILASPFGLNFSTTPNVGWALQLGSIFATSFSIQSGQLSPNTSGDFEFLASHGKKSVVSVTVPDNANVEVWKLSPNSQCMVVSNALSGLGTVQFTADSGSRYGGFAWYKDNRKSEISIHSRFLLRDVEP